MDEPTTLDDTFRVAEATMPSWNDGGPDLKDRKARAIELYRRAATAGHLRAMERLANVFLDPEGGFGWCIALARAGDSGTLLSALTSGDFPLDGPLGVLESAKQGEPWAQTAVGRVYRLGMRSGGVLSATRELAFGWLPAAKDPEAEGNLWLERAATAGWSEALLVLAIRDRIDAPARALGHLRAALREGGTLTPPQRAHAPTLMVELLERSDAAFGERIAAREALVLAGHGPSCAWLGDRHRLGEGVPRSVERAREFYEKGVAAGDGASCRELGRIHEEGLEVPIDDARARELYESAAEIDADPFARVRLAEKYGLTWYAQTKTEKTSETSKAAAKPAKAKTATKTAKTKIATAKTPIAKTKTAKSKPGKTKPAS